MVFLEIPDVPKGTVSQRRSHIFTQVFHLLLGFVENQIIYWDFKIRNSVRITEGLDNGASDNRVSTVL